MALLRTGRGVDPSRPEVPRDDRPVFVVTRKSEPEGRYLQEGLWDATAAGRRLDCVVEVDEATRVYVYVPE